MILPTSDTLKSDMWNTLSFGTTRLSRGATAQTSTSAATTPPQPRGPNKAPAPDLCIGKPPFQREHALGALLDEDDDEHQDRDLGQHRARDPLQKLVDDAQAHRRIDRPGKLAHAAQHHHHERID